MLEAKIVKRQCGPESTDALNLDVDDPAGSRDLDRLARSLLEGLRRLVETDRRRQFGLKRGQAVDVGSGQGLLDHQEIEVVERAEERRRGRRGCKRHWRQTINGISPKCCRIRADELDVFARADLDLHPLVAFRQVSLDGLEQLDDGRGKSDGQPGFDAAGCLARETRPSMSARLAWRVRPRRSQHAVSAPAIANRLPVQLDATRGDLVSRQESAGRASSGRDPVREVVPTPLGRVARVTERGGHRLELSPIPSPLGVSIVTRIASLTATSPPEIRNGSLSGI